MMSSIFSAAFFAPAKGGAMVIFFKFPKEGIFIGKAHGSGNFFNPFIGGAKKLRCPLKPPLQQDLAQGLPIVFFHNAGKLPLADE